jgi:O-antigen/teichoic acid export membrane protein
MTSTLRERASAARSDPLMVNSGLMLATTLLMAGGGALFWVLAARLQTPENVGLAGSLVASAETIALFAQLGLNIALVRTLPTSTRKAADIVTAGLVVASAGAVFAVVYGVLLPVMSPRLGEVLHSPWLVALFCVLVALTALNVLSDSAFLGLNKLRAYLGLNGVLLNVAKLGLPFALVGAGALGLYGAVAGAAALCAAASLWVIMRAVPGPRSLSPSSELLEARKFAGASYAQYALAVTPLLVYPVLVVNALGTAEAGAYFVSFQVAMLLHAALLALANAAYAEAERAATGRHRLVRRSAVTLVGGTAIGALALVLLAPYLLWIFGPHYVDEGTATLQVLALAVLCAAYNYWGALRLRLSRHLRAIVLVQLTSTVTMLGIGWALVPRGTVWVAASWAIGHLVGGVFGHVASLTVATFADGDPARLEDADPTVGERA